MRTLSTLALVFASFFCSLYSASAQTGPALLAVNTAAEPATPSGTTIVLTGRVESAAGPLVGAVVAVDGKTYQKAVTNSDGEFRLTVPATTEALSVTASYGGFKDVSATMQPGTALAPLRLTETHEINVGRKLQLKRYIKTAHKEARRESRQLHRA